MYVRLVLATLSLVLMGATKTATRLTPGELYPQVVQVECAHSRGSAFAIQGGSYLSVAHVTDDSGCRINGEPVEAAPETDLDFAVIKGHAKGGFKVNCEGFEPWTWVFAVGYARGWKWQTMVMLYATPWKTSDGLQILLGPPTVVPGHSGGIVMDKSGEARGTINRYTPHGIGSFSRPLQDTSLCR